MRNLNLGLVSTELVLRKLVAFVLWFRHTWTPTPGSYFFNLKVSESRSQKAFMHCKARFSPPWLQSAWPCFTPFLVVFALSRLLSQFGWDHNIKHAQILFHLINYIKPERKIPETVMHHLAV